MSMIDILFGGVLGFGVMVFIVMVMPKVMKKLALKGNPDRKNPITLEGMGND